MTYGKPLLLSLVLAGLLGGAQAAPAGWRHYTNAGLGYTIAYPAGWKIDTQYVNGALGPGREIHGVAFVTPESFQPGTNLSHNDTALSVESIAGAQCQPSQFVDPAEDVRTVHADGRTYTAATSGDAGAGNRYDTELFVVDGTSPCIAVRYFIHYAAVENFDPGSVKAFDRAKVIAAMGVIRATLKLGK